MYWQMHANLCFCISYNVYISCIDPSDLISYPQIEMCFMHGCILPLNTFNISMQYKIVEENYFAE